MQLVKLGNDLSIYLLCPFLAPIFMLLALYCLDFFDKNTKSSKSSSQNEENKNKYDTLMLFFLYLSMTFNGIFELFSTVSAKSKDADLNMSISIERSSDIEIKSICNNPTMLYIKKIIVPIGICAFFDISGYYLIILAANSSIIYEYIDCEVLIIQMVFLSIISKIMLNYQIYIHQKVSICFTIIGMICILSSTIVSYQKLFSWHIIYLFFSSISFSISIVYEKHIMQNKGVSPFKLLFYKGIFGTIINIIYIIIFELSFTGKFVLSTIFKGLITYSLFQSFYLDSPFVFVTF